MMLQILYEVVSGGGRFLKAIVITTNGGNIKDQVCLFSMTHVDLYVSLVLKFYSGHITPPTPKWNTQHIK